MIDERKPATIIEYGPFFLQSLTNPEVQECVNIEIGHNVSNCELIKAKGKGILWRGECSYLLYHDSIQKLCKVFKCFCMNGKKKLTLFLSQLMAISLAMSWEKETIWLSS